MGHTLLYPFQPMPLFSSTPKPNSVHVQKTLYELNDASEIRHLAIGAGARVVDLLDAKTGVVHDTLPQLMYALKMSTTRKTSVWGVVANIIGALYLADSIVFSTKMAFPKAFSYTKTLSNKKLAPKTRAAVKSVKYYWKNNTFVHDVSTVSAVDSPLGMFASKKQKTTKRRAPVFTTLLSAVFGLYLLSIPRHVPFQRRIPSNLSGAIVAMNQQSALDDRAFLKVTKLSDAAPDSDPPPLDYALTQNCLVTLYPTLHRLFEDVEPTPKQRSSSKTNETRSAYVNHPTLCTLRAALLRQRKVPIRPIHLFRTNSLPRESVAEIALAIAMNWQYREMPYYAYRGALRMFGRARSASKAKAKTAKQATATKNKGTVKSKSK